MWQAIFLSMDVEPEELSPIFDLWLRGDRRTPSDGISREFCNRLTVSLANISETGPIFPRAPRLGLYKHPRVQVALANVATFFRDFPEDLPMPMAMYDLANLSGVRDWRRRALEISGDAVKRSELVRRNAQVWPTIVQDLRADHINGLSAAAKVGVDALWLERKALGWAAARGKLRQKQELPVLFRPATEESSDPL